MSTKRLNETDQRKLTLTWHIHHHIDIDFPANAGDIASILRRDWGVYDMGSTSRTKSGKKDTISGTLKA